MSTLRCCPRAIVSAILVATAASTAYAADPSAQSGWQSSLQAATQGEATILKTFPGPEGLTGIVIGPAPGKADQGRVLGWGLPNGLLIVGELYDRHGRNLNDVVKASMPKTFAAMPTAPAAVQGEQGDAKMSDARANALLTSIEEVVQKAHTGIREGSASNTIYVFFDPRCGHCKHFYKDIHARKDVWDVTSVTWMPVALFGEASEKMAIAATTGLDNLKKVMEGEQAVEPSKDDVVRGRAYVLGNTMLLQATGRAATPMIAWRDAQGQAHIDVGYAGPSFFDAMLKAMRSPSAAPASASNQQPSAP